MWPFHRHVPSLLEAGIMRDFTDWHSHILPGVDDGVKTLEDSLTILRRYDEMGVKHLWLTPHIMEDYPNTTADLQRRFEDLKLTWDGNVELHLAAENMLDSLFEERLANRDFLPIGQRASHLLVETSYFNPPMNMDELLTGVLKAGYYPLLAHPERYRYMDENDYYKYRNMGIRFQINFMSLVGGYGETARKKAEWLLRKRMVDVTGSDLHRLAPVEGLLQHSPSKSDISELIAEVAARYELP